VARRRTPRRRLSRSASRRVVDLLAGAPDASPAVSSVLVTAGTGQRAVVSVNATAVGDLAAAARERVDEALDGATAVLADGHHLGAAVTIAAAARARGVRVALDGGSWKPGLDELLAHVDAAVLSADFRLPAAPGQEVDALLDAVAALGPGDVARSAGAGPVRVRSRDRDKPSRYELTPDAVPADEVVDTLGAGDVLHGGLAAGLASGEPFDVALRSGIEVATRSVRHPGALGWARG
jgi:sugar/nucleoside kinase (ribokinase family)